MLALISSGKSCSEISKALDVSAFTIRKHRSNICLKLRLNSTAQLVAYSLTQDTSQAKVSKKYPTKVSLSSRELDVLWELNSGLTSKQIAKNLNISYRTVEKHIQNIKVKAQLNKLAEIIKFANQIFTQDMY